MNEMVSPLALELHRAHMARKAKYFSTSCIAKENARLNLIAVRAREERVKRRRDVQIRREFLIHEAARSFALGVAQALAPDKLRYKISIHDIQAVVAKHFSVPMNDFLSHRRTRGCKEPSRRTVDIVTPRQVAMYLSKTITLRTLPEIGRRFYRDHTTVLSAIRKISAMMEADESFRAKVEELRAAVTGQVAG